MTKRSRSPTAPEGDTLPGRDRAVVRTRSSSPSLTLLAHVLSSPFSSSSSSRPLPSLTDHHHVVRHTETRLCRPHRPQLHTMVAVPVCPRRRRRHAILRSGPGLCQARLLRRRSALALSRNRERGESCIRPSHRCLLARSHALFAECRGRSKAETGSAQAAVLYLVQAGDIKSGQLPYEPSRSYGGRPRLLSETKDGELRLSLIRLADV